MCTSISLNPITIVLQHHGWQWPYVYSIFASLLNFVNTKHKFVHIHGSLLEVFANKYWIFGSKIFGRLCNSDIESVRKINLYLNWSLKSWSCSLSICWLMPPSSFSSALLLLRLGPALGLSPIVSSSLESSASLESSESSGTWKTNNLYSRCRSTNACVILPNFR